jgi:antitoxin VapB
MNLQIRDPRARILAERLADRRGVSMTEAVIGALEAELRRRPDPDPLADRLMGIADRLPARSGGTGRDFSREEIDALWGHG